MSLIKYENDIAVLEPDTASAIGFFEQQMRVIKKQEDELKKAILAEMEEKGIIKIETDSMIINYIAPTDRETFDSKAFRKDHAVLYDEYITMKPVKSSIRIKLKG